MIDFFKKTLHFLVGDDRVQLRHRELLPKLTRQQLIERESEIGGRLFGPVPLGRHRKFFNLNPTTWVWYEGWINKKGQPESSTTNYEVRQDGILKTQQGVASYYLNGQELANFLAATRLYYNRVARDVYHRDPGTGQPLAT